MAKTMKAAVVRAFSEKLPIEEVPMPTPGPGEVLVKVVATGVCHTDLHAAEGDWPVKPSSPFIPGHEGAGVVAAVGAGVTELKEGDLVGVAWLHDACGAASIAGPGGRPLCEHQRNTGYGLDGSFAEYVDRRGGVRRPTAGRDPDFARIATILCAGVTTYKGIMETKARPGEWVAVSGVGGLGHVAIQYAKAMGLHVAALDIAPGRSSRWRGSAGADLAVDARAPDAVKSIF